MDVTKLSSGLYKNLKKYVNNKSLYIIIIIGVVFMLIVGGEQKDDYKLQTFGEYSDEARLCSILEKVEGAGRVSVMITYYGTASHDVALTKKVSEASSEKEMSKSEESSVITSGGEPLIKGELYPEVKGALVISSGAGNIMVKKAITDAVCAALDIPVCRVCVLEGKDR